ncbi:hypothetical protein C0215_19815, partial [Clostridioides difficile]
MPDVPWGAPAVQRDSGPFPSARSVDQLSRANRAMVQEPSGLTSCPWRLRAVPEGPRIRLAVPGDSGPCPRARGVRQLSRASRAWVRAP